MANGDLNIIIRNLGHMRRYTQAAARFAYAMGEALDTLATELGDVPKMYCEDCGGELVLVVSDAKLGSALKRCPACGQLYGMLAEQEE